MNKTNCHLCTDAQGFHFTPMLNFQNKYWTLSVWTFPLESQGMIELGAQLIEKIIQKVVSRTSCYVLDTAVQYRTSTVLTGMVAI